METGKSNVFGTSYKSMVPKDEPPPEKQLPLHWTTPMQAYNNIGSTLFLNQHAAGSYMSPYMWPNQIAHNNTLLLPNALHNHRMLSNIPTVAQDAALAFSEIIHRTYGEQNLNSMSRCARNLQPKSLVNQEVRENGNGSSSVPTNDSPTNGSDGSPDEDHDTNNDILSTKKQQCNFKLVTADSTELNQNLANLNAFGSSSQFAMEKDKIRKERKRQSNRESAKRSRLRKQKECEELHTNAEILKDENSLLRQRLIRLSEECMELSNENVSIQEELVELYGPESVADLLPGELPDSVAGGHQNS